MVTASSDMTISWCENEVSLLFFAEVEAGKAARSGDGCGRLLSANWRLSNFLSFVTAAEWHWRPKKFAFIPIALLRLWLARG